MPDTPPQAASARAITSSVLGILSLLCGGPFLGVPAVVLAAMELSAIRKGESPVAGRAWAKTGLWTGIISAAFALLLLAALLAMISMGLTLQTFQQQLLDQTISL